MELNIIVNIFYFIVTIKLDIFKKPERKFGKAAILDNYLL